MEQLQHSQSDNILLGLPYECRPCPVARSKAHELSYWVSDGRLNTERASALIKELIGCSVALEIQLPAQLSPDIAL